MRSAERRQENALQAAKFTLFLLSMPKGLALDYESRLRDSITADRLGDREDAVRDVLRAIVADDRVNLIGVDRAFDAAGFTSLLERIDRSVRNLQQIPAESEGGPASTLRIAAATEASLQLEEALAPTMRNRLDRKSVV